MRIHTSFSILAALFLSCLSAEPPMLPPLPPHARPGMAADAPIPRFSPVENAFPAGLNASHCHWLDVDNDGRPDLLAGGDHLFLNESAPGAIRFKDISQQAHVMSGPSLCVDIDNDGWTDILCGKGQLLHNNHDGTFTDIAEQMGYKPHPKAMTLAAGDLDGNGFPDIVVGMSEDWNNGNPDYYPLQLWANDGKTLRECAVSAGIARSTYARGILIHDVNGDGRPDILVANYRLQPNLLWINRGGMVFRDEAQRRGVIGKKEPQRFYAPALRRHFGYSYGHAIGAAWFDMDNDGDLDLWISNLVHKYVGPTGGRKPSWDIRGYVCDDSAIYRNTNGFFQDRRTEMGVPPRPIGDRKIYQGDELWAGAAVADANNDGFQDIYIPQVYNLNYARALLFLNQRGAAFANEAETAGISRIDTYCGAWADVDGDGLMDLVTAGRPGVGKPAALVLYRNDGTDAIRRNVWLGVTLRSSAEGGTAVGARVAVTGKLAGGGIMRQTQLNCAGTSTMGQQNDPALHFGFPAGTTELMVDIAWPNGTTLQRKAQPGERITLGASK